MYMWVMLISIVDIALGGTQRIRKRLGTAGYQRKNRNHLDYSIAEVGPNTQQSPGDLKILARSSDARVKNSQGVKQLPKS